MENYQKLIIELKDIITAYEHLVKGIDQKAKISQSRAYGGIIRAGKGKLVESIAKYLFKISWNILGQHENRLSVTNKSIIKLPIKEDYIKRIKNSDIREFIENNKEKYFFPLSTDIHVKIDNKFVIAVECKSYTENAMLKRILVDFSLLKKIYPHLDTILFQLESQLGGDYSEIKDINWGSPSTHTLLSYFDIDLYIITLLEGERKVDKPIHKPEFYKPLKIENLLKALNTITNILEKYK